MYQVSHNEKDYVEVDSFCAWQLVAESIGLFGEPQQPIRQVRSSRGRNCVVVSFRLIFHLCGSGVLIVCLEAFVRYLCWTPVRHRFGPCRS